MGGNQSSRKPQPLPPNANGFIYQYDKSGLFCCPVISIFFFDIIIFVNVLYFFIDIIIAHWILLY